jgi:hypothetical protein
VVIVRVRVQRGLERLASSSLTRFAKLRELVTLARTLEHAPARTANGPNAQGRTDRLVEAEQYRAKAEWLAGRIDGDEYNARLVECADAKAYPID